MPEPTVHRAHQAAAAAPLIGWAVTVASTLVILLLTLTPTGARHQLATEVGFCVICGEFGTANLLRNVVLFVPLGLGLGLAIRRPLLAWLPALALTLGIEVAQFFIPGRNPLPIDVVANATGAALGILFLRSVRGRARAGRLSAWGWALLPFGVLAGTAVAFQLAPPDPPHFVQLTPSLGHLETYRGQVDTARLGDEILRIGRHPDPDGLEARLLGGARLEVALQAGPAPPGLAPVVSVYTGARRELFLLGADRDDVVLRLPHRAARLHLHPTDLRLEDGLAGVAPGQGVRLAFRMDPAPGTADPERRGDAAVCLAVDGRETCGLRPGIRKGWGLLFPPALLPRHLRNPLGVLWLLGLGFLPGLVSRSALAAGGAAAALVGFTWGLPSFTGSMAGVAPVDLALLVGGVALGAFVRVGLHRHRAGRPGATPVAPPQHR